MPQEFPSRLGPYEIVSTLGEGGMGRVYLARDTRLGRRVALKVLPDDVMHDPYRRARFEQEAKLASALNHSNIVSIYDVGSEQGLMYIVSELVEGESLRALIDRGPVAPARALEIAAPLARAMAAAHSAGVIHRDLKPENIMLTRDGMPKILDFGLAKQMPGSGDPDSAETQFMTTPGAIVGTASYMSPEQVRVQRPDQRSDIFSFGAVLYEMVSGKRPFLGSTSIEILAAILNLDPPPLSVPDCPGLNAVVQRCLQKEPAARFQSAGDLALALESLQAGAAPARPRPRTAMWVGLAACLAIAVGGVSYWAAVRTVAVRNERRDTAKAVEQSQVPAPGRSASRGTPATQPARQVASSPVASVTPKAVEQPQAPERSTPPAPPTTQPANQAPSSPIASVTPPAPSAAPAPAPAPEPPKPARSPASSLDPARVAMTVAQALADERYSDAALNFSDSLKSNVPAARLERDWKTLRQGIGDFRWLSKPYPGDGNTLFVWFEFQHGTADLQMGFDRSGKLSALNYIWLAAIESAPPSSQPANPQHAQQAFRQGENLFNQAQNARGRGEPSKDKYEEAARYYSDAILADPGYAQAYTGRCAAEVWSAHYPNAVLDCTQSIRLNPSDEVAFTRRGDALTFSGHWDFSIPAHKEAVRLNPDGGLSYNQFTNAYWNGKRYDRCVETATAGIDHKVNNPSLWFGRAACYEQLGKYDLAIEDVTYLVGVLKDAQSYNRRGALYIETKQYEKALSDFNQAIRLKPDFKDAYNNRGFAKDMLGDAAGAATDRDYARTLK